MPLHWNQHLSEEIEGVAAEGLLRAAAYFAGEHQVRLSVSSPHHAARRRRDTAAGPKGSQYQVYDRPSGPGEYPKLRTGHGRASATYEPTTPAEVVAEGLRVRIGYRKIIRDPWANYLLVLESKGWRGLLETLEAVRPALPRVARG